MNGHAKTSRLAIASFVLSLLVCVPFIPAALAVVLGIVSIVRIRRHHPKLKGRGFALAGTLISVFALFANWMSVDEYIRSYKGTSPVTDTILLAASEGTLAEAEQHLSRRFLERTPEEIAPISDMLARHGTYESKRWARIIEVDSNADQHRLTIGYLVRYSRSAEEIPVNFVFIIEDAKWKLDDVKL